MQNLFFTPNIFYLLPDLFGYTQAVKYIIHCIANLDYLCQRVGLRLKNEQHYKIIKMKKLLLLALFAIGATMYVQAQQSTEKVAVYVSGDVSSNYKKIISAKAVSRISRSENYAAVERTDAFLDVLTKEQDYQLSGEVRDNQIVELGVRFGVRYVAVFETTQTMIPVLFRLA